MQETGIHYLSRKDIVLEEIITKVKTLPTIESSNDVYYDLVSCIVDQQIHYRATKQGVFNKIVKQLQPRSLTPDTLFTLSETQFAAFKLSEQKYQTLLRITEFFQKNKLGTDFWSSKTNNEVHKILSEIPGVGNWTMDMILLYTLERPDVFPADDYHLKNLMVQLYQLDPKSRLKSQMLEVAAGWSPHQSIAVRNILAWKDLNKKYKT